MRPAGGSAFEAMTRIGFAARGIMYVLIGYLTLRTGHAEDGEGILEYLDSGTGRILLAAMTAGFFAYGAWRLLEAWYDSAGRGTEAKGLGIRAAGALSGLIHLGLGVAALLHLLDAGGGGGGGDSSEEGAATALSLPGGGFVLMLVAALFLAAAAGQIGKAWKGDFLRRLAVAGETRRWVGWLGRAGFLARGIVFALIAILFWRAGSEERSSEAGGLAEAVQSLPPTLQMAVAAGLLLFGLFSLAEARFRRIEPPAG